MKDNNSNSLSIWNNLILCGIVIGILFWIFESSIHVLVFHHGSLIEQIISPEPHELWMRLIIIGVFILFSIYAQSIVTKLRHTEKVMRKSEEKHRPLIENSSDCICHIDLDGNIIYMNPGGVKLNELDNPTEMIGLACTTGIKDKYKGMMEDAINRAKNGESVSLEYKSINVKGTELWWESIVGPINDAKGNIVSLIRISRDITERKKAEKALRKSEEKYRDLFENARDSICIVDLEGNFKVVNEATELLTGYSQDELLKMRVDDLVYQGDKEKSNLYFKKLVDEGGYKGYEGRIITKDGKTKDISVSSTVIKENDKIVGSRDIIHDVTERKKTEEALKKYSDDLKESNRLKDLFIDIIKHDLLNPASVTRTMSSLALEEEKDPRKKEILQLIDRSNTRMISIIENASVLARLESQEIHVFQKTNLGKAMKNAIKDLMPIAEKKKHRIALQSDGEYKAKANPLVYNVFYNLIHNAIKYSPEDCQTDIKIEEDNSNWKISVSDCGKGIPDEYKETIFSRFRRIDKEGVEGTGLGLAIVKKIVEAHKGHVWVEDNPEGGSIFFVTLPQD